MTITFRKFMQIVRRFGVQPAYLKKVEKYTGRPYRKGISDLPAWKGKTIEGERLYITIETGCHDAWHCEVGDNFAISTLVH